MLKVGDVVALEDIPVGVTIVYAEQFWKRVSNDRLPPEEYVYRGDILFPVISCDENNQERGRVTFFDRSSARLKAKITHIPGPRMSREEAEKNLLRAVRNAVSELSTGKLTDIVKVINDLDDAVEILDEHPLIKESA